MPDRKTGNVDRFID